MTPGELLGAGLAETTVRQIDLPPGWVEITDWREALEAFRSPHVGANRGSPTDEAYFRGGTVIRIDGPEHRDRRRAMNRLLKGRGHAWFRERALHPAVARNLEALLRERGADGKASADLVPFGFRLHVQMAATLAGLDGADTEEGADTLLALNSAISLAAAQTNVESLYVQGPTEAAVAAALEAKARYEERFFRPSVERRRALLADVEAGRLDEAALPKDLLTLVAAGADPSWEDDGLAIRESLLVIRATVGSSTQAMLRVIDELWRWLEDHPEDRRLLTDDAFLIGAVKDALRLYPSQPGFVRYALEDFTLSSGREIKQGEHLVIRAGIAARDASVFGEDADRFNPRRPAVPGSYSFGLSFASGPHMCFGLPLVMGAEGIDGSLFYTVKQLFGAGMEPDPERRPTRVQGIAAFRFATYPVLFAG